MSIQGSQLRIAPKNPVRAATTGDVTLSGGAPDTLDGVSLATNDRILVWQQSAGAENGLYRVQTLGTGADGTWVRTEDYDTVIQDHIEAGLNTYVQEGTRHGGKTFILTTTGAITIGVTSTTFVDISDKNSVSVVRAGGASSTDLNSDTGFAFFNMTTSATETVNLPPADDVQGRQIFILFEGDGTGSVTLDGFGAETINGGATYAVTQGDMVMLNSLGASTGFGATVINGGGGGGGISGSTGGTDNVLIRSDGTGGSTVQASNTTLDDSSNMAGLASLSMNEQSATPASAAGTGVFYVSDEVPSVGVFLDDAGTTRIFAKASDGIVYVGKHGDNANDGYSEANAVLTIATALTQAAALTPSTSNRIEIRILGGGTYTESVTLPAFVSLNAPEATLDGNLVVGSDCHVKLHRATDSSSAPTVAVSSAGERWIEINDIDNTGTGNAFSVSSASAVVHLDVGQMVAAAATTFIATAGQIYGNVGLVGITGANNGIQLSSGGTADARLRGLVVGHIDDTGTGTGIRHENAFTQELFVGNLDASTTYDVINASGVLNLFVGEMTGSAGTITGTANVTEAGAGGGGTTAPTQTNSVFVSKAGSDANSGLTKDDPKLTIGSALTAASGLSPGVSNRITVFIQDGGIYTEDIQLPGYVSLDGPGATLTGTGGANIALQTGLNTVTRLHRITSAATVEAVRTGNGENWLIVDEIIGNAGGIETSLSTTVTHVDIGRIEVATSAALFTPTGAAGRIHGTVGEIEITGAGYGLFLDGGQMDLTIERITETGSAISGIDLDTTGSVANISVGDFDVDPLYDIVSGATLNLVARNVTGSPGTVNGTANVVVTDSVVTSATLTRSMPASSGDSVELGSISSSSGQVLGLAIFGGSSSSTDYTAYHRISLRNAASTGGFLIHQPLYTSGPSNQTLFGDLVQLEIDVAVGGEVTLRARSYIGIAQDVIFRLTFDGNPDGLFTPSSTQATTTPATTNYSGSSLTMTEFLVTPTGGTGIAAWQPLYLEERAASDASPAGFGQLWVRDDTPNVLVFTDDAGTDTVLGLGGGGGSSTVKTPARVATTSNISNLSTGAPDTVDGISLATSDRVLVWNQTSADENGVYVVDVVGTGADGQWSRATDFDDAVVDGIEAGVEVYCQEGDTNGQVKFILTSTGTLTIGSSNLDFVPMGGLVRTEGSSTEIQAATTFTTAFKYTSTVNMRDYNELAVFFEASALGGTTDVNIIIQWSDDGSTVAFADGEYTQLSDFNITSNTDGSFNPKTYTANLTTGGGELVAGQGVHLSFPKRGGVCRIGVQGDVDAVGSYTIRAQRLVV